MNYDIEREKHKSEELRKVFREMFPLVNEHHLPWTAVHIRSFLTERIAQEIDQGTKYFTRAVVRILCEVSPPKTHIEDMARICVEEAKKVPALEQLIEDLRAELAKCKSGQ